MVNTGKPSTGCVNCRARHIKASLMSQGRHLLLAWGNASADNVIELPV